MKILPVINNQTNKNKSYQTNQNINFGITRHKAGLAGLGIAGIAVTSVALLSGCESFVKSVNTYKDEHVRMYQEKVNRGMTLPRLNNKDLLPIRTVSERPPMKGVDLNNSYQQRMVAIYEQLLNENRIKPEIVNLSNPNEHGGYWGEHPYVVVDTKGINMTFDKFWEYMGLKKSKYASRTFEGTNALRVVGKDKTPIGKRYLGDKNVINGVLGIFSKGRIAIPIDCYEPAGQKVIQAVFNASEANQKWLAEALKSKSNKMVTLVNINDKQLWLAKLKEQAIKKVKVK